MPAENVGRVSPTEATCEHHECHQLATGVVELDRFARAGRHPSSQAWAGRLVCDHHADVARRMDERYGLGIVVRRFVQVGR